MKHYTKEEWAREQYTGQWSDSPFNRDMVERGELPAYYLGRRNVMVGGPRGCTLLTEGVHFLVDGDYSHLPLLDKSVALEGAWYQFAGGVAHLRRVYRLDEEYAREHQLVYVERVETSIGDFALPGGDIRSDLRKEGQA